MNIERLVQMANDIANYFASEPDRAAGIEGVALHIERFWEPRMRKQIMAHVETGGSGLSALALAALELLRDRSPST
jgi:formate dehydrogenase subunit delta